MALGRPSFAIVRILPIYQQYTNENSTKVKLFPNCTIIVGCKFMTISHESADASQSTAVPLQNEAGDILNMLIPATRNDDVFAGIRNADIEQFALTQGKDRYLKRQADNAKNKGEASRDSIIALLKSAVPIVGARIAEELAVVITRNTPFAVRALQGLDPDLIALVCLSRAFETIHIQSPSLTRACRNIGAGIEDELWAADFLATNPTLAKRLTARAVRSHGNVKYRRKSVRAVAKKEGFAHEELSHSNRIQIGGWLVNILLITLPVIFEVGIVKASKSLQRYLTLTDEASDALLNMTEYLQWLQPAHMPMTLPPRDWADFDTGAYYNPKLARTVKLVRTFDAQHVTMLRDAIADGQMTYCFEAVNTIQRTEWRINTRIRDLVRWCWEQGKVFDGFPRREFAPMPAHLENWEELSEERKKGWKISAAKIAEANRAVKADRSTMISDLMVADILTDQKFYLPHNMDFRGRVYPVPHFNQQRADHVKAMLEFHEGKPLGEDGLFWLAVHVANCGDFDKISKSSLTDRYEWTFNNSDMLVYVARDPEGTFDIWSKADKPFQFVAACIAWLNGYDADCHIPISLDGSNSGLQHYSAALRSPEGALVNLTPQDAPADIYQAVADAVTAAAKVDEKAMGDNRKVAWVVLDNGVTRKLVKRNVMTFAYSSQQFGFKRQLMEDLMKPLSLKVLTGELPYHPYGMPYKDKDGNERPSDDGFQCASYLAKQTWAAVNAMVKDASVGMHFFRRCAQVLAHESKGLSWVTPIGLPVLHKYPEWTVKQLKLFLYDKAIPVDMAAMGDRVTEDGVLKQVQLSVQISPSSRIDKSKAANAVAPNVIHSLDASHLMLTVLECKDNGITDFSLVHDCFAVHAADTGKLFALVREAFVGMYEAFDPFEEIYNSTLDALDDKSKVPPMPAKGNLDLNLIKESDYAFA